METEAGLPSRGGMSTKMSYRGRVWGGEVDGMVCY